MTMAGDDDDDEDERPYVVENVKEVNIKKFQTKGTNYTVRFNNTMAATSFPGSFLYAKTRRKDPGRGWARVPQILRGKFKTYPGRGGKGAFVSCWKMLRLKMHELMCFRIDFAT